MFPDKEIEKIVDFNPSLNHEYAMAILYYKKNMRNFKKFNISKKAKIRIRFEKNIRKLKNTFLQFSNIDVNLKMNKYFIGVTFSGIIFALNFLGVLSNKEIPKLSFTFFFFFASSITYLLAAYYLSDKEIFAAMNKERLADLSISCGIIAILVELYHLPQFNTINYQLLIISLIAYFIFLIIENYKKRFF